MNSLLKISFLSGLLLLLAGCADVYTPYYPQTARNPYYRHDNGNHYGQRKQVVIVPDDAYDDRGYYVAPQRYNDSHAYKKFKKHHKHEHHGHDDD